jgi:hypothetical protein
MFHAARLTASVGSAVSARLGSARGGVRGDECYYEKATARDDQQTRAFFFLLVGPRHLSLVRTWTRTRECLPASVTPPLLRCSRSCYPFL